MLGVSAGVICGNSAEGTKAYECVRDILSKFGLVLDEVHLASLDDSVVEKLREVSRRVPLLVLVIGRADTDDWVFEAPEAFENTLVIVFIDSANPRQDSLPDRYDYVVRFREASETQLVLDAIEVLNKTKEAITVEPWKYVPIAERTPEIRAPYRVLSVAKRAIISPDGHGCIEFYYSLEITGADFEYTSHYFGLSAEVPAERRFPPLEQMMNRPMSDRYLGQSFSYQLLFPPEKWVQMTVVEIREESDDRTKVIRFLFTPRLQAGQFLKYAMAWSHPYIYIPHGKDSSTFRCIHDYDELRLSFLFLSKEANPSNVFCPNCEPVLHVYNPVGLEIARLQGCFQNDLYGLNYSWHLPNLLCHTSLIVNWERR